MEDNVAIGRTQSTRPGLRRVGLLQVAFAALVSVIIVAVLVGGGIYLWHSQGPSAANLASVNVASAGTEAPPSASSTEPSSSLSTRQVGDWAVVCPAGKTGSGDCFIQQQLRTRDQKQIILVWTVRKDATGVHAVWEVPSDVAQERGLVLDLGDGKPKGLSFSACTNQSCIAKALLAPDFVRSISSSSNIVAAVSAPGKDTPIRFALSSKGFADALAGLSGRY